MKVLRIAGWAEHFESSESRKLKRLEWVPMPNKHDGSGFTELCDHPEGDAHFGAWVKIVQIASKCPVRGVLAREDGRALDAAALARMCHSNRKVMENAIPRLVAIGWLESVEIETEGATGTARQRTGPAGSDAGGAGSPAAAPSSIVPPAAGSSAGVPGDSAEVPGESAGNPVPQGREREGRGTREELKDSNSHARTPTKGILKSGSPPCPGPALETRRKTGQEAMGPPVGWFIGLGEWKQDLIRASIHLSNEGAAEYERDLAAAQTLVGEYGFDQVIFAAKKLIKHGSPPFATKVREALRARAGAA